jgi:hypothetical protein
MCGHSFKLSNREWFLPLSCNEHGSVAYDGFQFGNEGMFTLVIRKWSVSETRTQGHGPDVEVFLVELILWE